MAIDAIEAAARPHLFPSLTREGAPALLETTGNPDCHLVLRGGTVPNHDADSVAAAGAMLDARGIGTGIVIDCSHGNSGKDPQRQGTVLRSVLAQRAAGNRRLVGVMLESHLVAGRQDQPEVYGQSITDGCLGWDETRELLEDAAASDVHA